jgi:hypothetical protein
MHSRLVRTQSAATRMHAHGERFQKGMGGVTGIVTGVVTALAGIVALMEAICPPPVSEPTDSSLPEQS